MAGVDGRVCVVTGGGRGIGRRIAERLAQAGAAVCVADVDGAGAECTASEIEAAGGRALGVGCDVSDRASVRSAIAETVDAFGRLDVIFNNAGVSQTQRFMDITEVEWERIMRVNGLGVLICMQEAASQMIRQGEGGKIVNTASIAGKEGFPLFAAYSASKFAVVALTQAGARALAEDKITVNAICPGVVTTELWEQLDREFIELGETQKPGQALEEFGAGILAGRLSTPDDVAGLALFLASDEASYITGQAINVDGGMVFH
jgi:meso-butanediol dehydrogenase / (S,S)-butanediol dehydrogenase / diacetyl reductase